MPRRWGSGGRSLKVMIMIAGSKLKTWMILDCWGMAGAWHGDVGKYRRGLLGDFRRFLASRVETMGP